jgi:AbiTii
MGVFTDPGGWEYDACERPLIFHFVDQVSREDRCMSSLVEELQANALSRNVSVIELLQKCVVVATKLGVSELADWARNELDGYNKRVPEYRIVHGTPQVFNPYRGYMPLHCADVKQAESLSRMHFNQPIGELEYELRQAEKSGSDSFQVSYALKTERMLMNAIDFGLRPTLHVNASQFRRILDAVRKIVLEWSLKLEADGIRGEGMAFSREEKARAKQKAVTYNIKNYIHGQFDRSQVQVEAQASSQRQEIQQFGAKELASLVATLKEALPNLALSGNQAREFAADLQTLESQAQLPSPKAGIVREVLLSIRSVLENATGSLLASGLLQQVGRFLGA